jgi:hypothetical protein
VTDVPLAPATVRLYARCTQIEDEIDEALDGAEPVDLLIERCDRSLKRAEEFRRTGDYDDTPDECELAKAKLKTGMLARHREYQWRKAELGRLLGLGPDDINPLDLDFDQEWESADDPRIEVWRRALELRRRLDRAHLDLILWWRAPPPLQVVSTAREGGDPCRD